MRRALPFVFALLVFAFGPPAAAREVDLPRNPSISPDGESIVFSWRGDLWHVSHEGGRAQRLTAHPASDLRSAWSPNGRRIAFNSRRGGALNVFTMKADGSEVTQVTHSDVGVVLGQYAHEGKTLTFHARIEGDVYKSSRPYLVRAEGGPHRRLINAFGSDAVVSPDGLRVAFVRGASSWLRRGYRGPDSRDVWLYDFATARFTRLTTWAGNDGMPHWQDAQTLLFVSDRDQNRANVFRLALDQPDAKPVRLTSFVDRDVSDLDVSRDGKRAVVAAWDRLYRLDLEGSAITELKISAPEDEGERLIPVDVSDKVSEAKLSPDGKTLAVIAYGEVFVRALGKQQPTRRVTRSAARESGIAWSPDGERLYFVSDRDGSESIYAAEVSLTREEVAKAYDAATESPAPKSPEPASQPSQPEEPEEPGSEGDEPEAEAEPSDPAAGTAPVTTQGKGDKSGKGAKEPKAGERWRDALRFRVLPIVCDSAQRDRDPRPSPDGSLLAFRRGSSSLVLLDLATQEQRVLVRGWDDQLHWRWNPRGDWIAYSQQDRDFNSEVFVVRVDGETPAVNVSMHPDDDYDPQWSADGKILSFLSTRHEGSDVWAVYLDRALEAKPARDLTRYYKDAAKAAAKRKPLEPTPVGKAKGKAGAKAKAAPLELDLERAWERLRKVTPWSGDEGQLLMAPGGEAVYVQAEDEGGGRALYRVGYDGKGRRRLAGNATPYMLSLDGKQLVAVERGRPLVIDTGSGKVTRVDVRATLRVETSVQNERKLREAARILGARFYHPTMKGLDWAGLTERYASLAKRAVTSDEFYDVAQRLVGELNASHLGIYAPRERSPLAEASGRLGVDVVPREGGFSVVRVLPLGPAAGEDMRLLPGDRIVEIERRPFAPTDTLELRLRGRVGRDTLVTVQRHVVGQDQPRELLLLLRPVSGRAEDALRYRAWCADNARRVHEWSKGRLGYLHIRAMNQGSLITFERDLYAAGYGKEGLVIDVRNNGGGWTADRVLGSLMVRPHAYTVPRGADATYTRGYPRGRLFIQRYTRPANLLCNEKSFSNAEILSHAFKTLGRGKLVGQQTYGGVISTGATTLVDGTRVRLPFRGWYLPDGTDMENNGAKPDLVVEQTPEDEVAGYDRQLRVAVDDVLGRLGN